MEEALKTRADNSVSTKVLIELMELVLKYTIFEFDRKLFIQLIGTAIGTIMAPTVANILMAMIGILVLECATMNGASLITLMKRFIDDFLLFWTGPKESFEFVMIKINNLHPTIKFTSSYDYENRSTTFLDIEIQIVDGIIKTDMYMKKTAKKVSSSNFMTPNTYVQQHSFLTGVEN